MPDAEILRVFQTIQYREGADMSRQPLLIRTTLAAVAFAAAGITGVAFADDSSMSRLTGDSYAFFNDLDYRAGKFNVARGRQIEDRDAYANGPSSRERGANAPMVSSTRPQPPQPAGPIRDDRGT